MKLFSGVFLWGVALVIFACTQTAQTAFHGELGPNLSPRTSLLVPSRAQSVVVRGSLTLVSGTLAMELRGPDGVVERRTWNQTLDQGGFTTEVGPLSYPGRPGEWVLTLIGDENARGTYDLEMQARD